MLEQMGDVSRIGEFVNRAKDKTSGFRLMGFGHRVYKNMDPRAAIMRQTCYEVLDELGCTTDPLFKMALKLEQIAWKTRTSSRRSSTPMSITTPASSCAPWASPLPCSPPSSPWRRTAGWIAQWNEMIVSPGHKIARPRQLYTGPHAASSCRSTGAEPGCAYVAVQCCGWTTRTMGVFFGCRVRIAVGAKEY